MRRLSGLTEMLQLSRSVFNKIIVQFYYQNGCIKDF